MLSFLTKTAAELPKDIGFDFDWSNRKVWAVKGITPKKVHVSKLAWHLDVPFWEHGKDDYSVSARQVLENPKKYPQHAERIEKADLDYPIDVMKDARGRLTILDSLHRYAKAVGNGDTHVMLRELPRRRVAEIVK